MKTVKTEEKKGKFTLKFYLLYKKKNEEIIIILLPNCWLYQYRGCGSSRGEREGSMDLREVNCLGSGISVFKTLDTGRKIEV